MVLSLVRKIFGTKNERELRRMGRAVESVNALEDGLKQLTDDALRARTVDFRQRLAAGATLDDLLPEAFAVAREASLRVMGMRHFDVQLIGAMTLHEGRIAEMRTGEGKTLTATLAVYLNALAGKGVHVVTVNDYLASRDAEWMRPLYEFLGMTVGVVRSQQDPQEKREAYRADITYGTNNEYGFDYLRDNMAFALDDKAQRGLNFAIVDEVDSILIDEARTPLIISGQAEDSSRLYIEINKLIPLLRRQKDENSNDGDYTVDEKHRQVELTEAGHESIEGMLVQHGLLPEGDSLYAPGNLSLLHHVHAALKAHILFLRDVHYIVQGQEIVIVDEHTGRIMPGRRWSEGIHQAIEAKEKVSIQHENQTLATTTFQNYFRLYRKLSGMTGTADTEAPEFRQIYNLDVVVIPTNRQMLRKDMDDLVFLSREEKYEAIINEVKELVLAGAPVLVGTTSVESSELLSNALKKDNIGHQVLNAKFHAHEAEIIAQAGKPGTVTIATNMAGRGTDIVLGGSIEKSIQSVRADEALSDAEKDTAVAALREQWDQDHARVIKAGGLHIIGTERHESRRIDNQLRGRSGRQGDPGLSRFYLSLEDDLMRIFASDRVKSMMQSLGMQRGEAIEHRWVTRAIENAQRKVEARNFDLRKNLLKYDDVANDQRRVIYQQRDELLAVETLRETVAAVREDVLQGAITGFMPPETVVEQWDIPGLEAVLANDFALSLPIQKWLDQDDMLNEAGVRERILAAATEAYVSKRQQVGDEVMDHLEKQLMLQLLDRYWKEHLAAMDYLRQGIHLRGYAQKQPEQEYKREAFELFQQMLNEIKMELIQTLTRIEIRRQEEVDAIEEQRRREAEAMDLTFQHAAFPETVATEEVPDSALASTPAPFVRPGQKVGRNDVCPCGSGKKYKQCHGKIEV